MTKTGTLLLACALVAHAHGAHSTPQPAAHENAEDESAPVSHAVMPVHYRELQALTASTTRLLDMAVVTMKASVLGYSTYQLQLIRRSTMVQNIYALAGLKMRNGVDRALTMPPAWQIEHTKSTAGALGTNVGGVQPAFFQLDPSLQFDSWLTLGNGEHDKVTTLSMAKDLHDWSTTTPILCSDCAVFYMDPTAGPTKDTVTIAQLTVKQHQKWSASVGHVQGRKRQPQSVKELENNNWEVGPFTYTSEMIGKPPEPIAEVDWSYDTEPKRDPPPHASDDASWSHLSMAFMLGAAVASVVLLFAFRRKICLVRERYCRVPTEDDDDKVIKGKGKGYRDRSPPGVRRRGPSPMRASNMRIDFT